MKRLNDDIIQFFQNQGCVIVSTIKKDGTLHSACKGIVEINSSGTVYLLDLYRQKTHENLKHNSHISITAVDEHRFKGYCLIGQANIVKQSQINPRLIKDWENRIASRITQRVLKNIREEKGHPRHPEALLPKPEYLIVIDVKEVVDLTPHHLKTGA